MEFFGIGSLTCFLKLYSYISVKQHIVAWGRMNVRESCILIEFIAQILAKHSSDTTCHSSDTSCTWSDTNCHSSDNTQIERGGSGAIISFILREVT